MDDWDKFKQDFNLTDEEIEEILNQMDEMDGYGCRILNIGPTTGGENAKTEK